MEDQAHEEEVRECLKESLSFNLKSFSGKQLEKATQIFYHLISCKNLCIGEGDTAFRLFDEDTFRLFDEGIDFVEYLSNVTDSKNHHTNIDFERVTLQLIENGAPKELFLK